MPVGYFLTSSLDGVQKKNLVTQCLTIMHNCNVDIQCLTFDGAASNVSMAKNLGCSFDIHDLRPNFPHPVTKSNVNVFLDACHMLKLVRNTLGECGYIRDDEGLGIKYAYIKKTSQSAGRNWAAS